MWAQGTPHDGWEKVCACHLPGIAWTDEFYFEVLHPVAPMPHQPILPQVYNPHLSPYYDYHRQHKPYGASHHPTASQHYPKHSNKHWDSYRQPQPPFYPPDRYYMCPSPYDYSRHPSTVRHKTISMFATFEFFCLFLHNQWIKSPLIWKDYAHTSCLKVCQISRESIHIWLRYSPNKSDKSLKWFCGKALES